MTTITVYGDCQRQFLPLKEQFAQHFQLGLERGAALAVFIDGRCVVDLWAGTRDKEGKEPWQQDTLVNLFSTSKAVTALCVQRAIDQGFIDVEKPVSYYWPGFARAGKRDIKVAWLLNHRAGLPAVKKSLPPEALFDWQYMIHALEQQEPWWQPGEQHGYHMITYGWLVGEVFHRAVGVSVGTYLRQELAEPLGLDIGLGLSDSQLPFVADLAAAKAPPEPGRVYLFDVVMRDLTSITAKAMANPPSLMSSSNKPEWRTMELPSANAHASAGSLARLFGLAVSGEQVISEVAQRRCMVTESQGYDPVLLTSTRFGPGFMLQQAGDIEAGFGAPPRVFGHPGAGGVLAFADPDRRLGFAYVMNQMGPYVLIDPRPRALVDALYGCFES